MIEIKIEYKNGNVFSLTADENNVRNVTACLLDECVPFGKCKNLYKSMSSRRTKNEPLQHGEWI